jgi:hypothetical protein
MAKGGEAAQLPGGLMSPRTIYLSRLIGLFTLVVAASLIVDKPQAMATMAALLHDRSALIIIGVLGTAAGMAIVLAHQVWSGGPLLGRGDPLRLGDPDPRDGPAVPAAACDRPARRVVSLR